MKEYMFYIRNATDAKSILTSNEHDSFIQSCEVYIEKLKSKNQLIAAQPLVREGVCIRKNSEDWAIENISTVEEVQVGYYHIRATNMDEAITIAKENPEFAYVPSASISIYPVKLKEEKSGFEYPTHA